MADKNNKSEPNWPLIKAEYQAGTKVSELAKKHNIKAPTIYSRISRAEKSGEPWGKPLKDKVAQRTADILALTQADVSAQQAANLGHTEQQNAIESSAIANVIVIEEHRTDIRQARTAVNLYKNLVMEKLQNPTATLMIKGKPIDVEYSLEDLGKSLGHFMKAANTAFQLERQAHDLDVVKEGDGLLEFSYSVE